MDDLEKLLYMLEIQILRDQKDRAIAGLKKRGFSDERLLIVDQIVALDDLRKDQQTQLDVQLNERNTLSDEIGNLFKSGKGQEANQLKIKVQAIKEAAETLEVKLQQTKSDLDAMLVSLPNIPHANVPEGRTPEDNKVHQAWDGDFPTLPAGALLIGNLQKNIISLISNWVPSLPAVDFHCTGQRGPFAKGSDQLFP